ncbi:gp58-like family protein [Lactobacillus johnsonii]|uniref:gp58-like family protein n=1 Tax=Lactobacillus johnsonii TaxID=33959 RepID=UPI0031F2C71C
MLKQIKEVQDAWRATQRTLDIKVIVNGKTYEATDINSLKYDSGAYTGDTFAIGSTYSNNVQIEFSHLVEGLELGMEVRPSIGIKTSKGYIYEPLGVFIISSEIKMDRNNNLTSISASDRFVGLEGKYKSKLVYPAKVLDIIAEICAQSGVKANADDLARLPHQSDLPIPISGQSYRKALGWIAQLYAGYATFDRQGLFTIRTIAEPNYELDPSQYEQAGLTKNEAPYKVGGIRCQTVITTKTRDGENTEETKTYQVGDTSGSQIKLENNIMTPDRLNNIWEQIKDVNFYPFNLNWFGNPAIEAGDWLRLEDKQGNKFIVPNNSYTLDFNGGLSATSKADQTSSTDSTISWRGTYAQIIEELQARKAPDGTVIFPPSVVEPPKNAKPNDVWFKQNGNSTELWVFTAQEDGSGKWVRRDLTPDEIKNQIQEAQSGLNDAKKQIADNLAKADGDIAELNASIRDQKKAFDTDIDELNASIRDQKGTIDGLSTTINTVAIPKITEVTNKVSDALTKINDQKNIVTGLQTQSAQQGKDISKITTDIHGVSVDLANLNGDVNQTKVTVQGLQSTLGNAQGDIAQIKVDAKKLETSLSGKVDNSTYATFVNQTNQALNAKLIASDLRGYAKTTDVQATANGLQVNINSIADRMNNFKIGSQNLLLNTANFKNYFINTNGSIDKFSENNYISAITNHPEITSYMHTWGDWQSAYSKQKVLLEKDKTYWFGFYVCTDKSSESPCTNLNIYSNEDDNVSNAKFWGYLNAKDYSFWNKAKYWIWHAIKIVGDGKVYQNFRVEPSGKIGAGSAYFAGYTLVQSDIEPTGYVSSFEDTNHELSQLSAQITANNQKFSSYYTKIETDNRANSAKNDAVNAIKNDNNWHGLSNILTNSGFLQNADGFIQKVQQATVPMFSGSGINLVSGTSNIWGDSGWNDFNGTSNQTKVIGKFYLDGLTAGDWVTLHLDYQYQNLSGSNLAILVQGCGDKTGWSYEPFNLPWQSLQASSNLKWGSFNKTFQITNEALKNYYFTAQIRIDNAKGGWLQWRSFKIEKGKVATPWSASPNDYTNLQSQISQTAGTVSTMVGRVNNLETKTNVQIINHSIDLNTYTSTGTYFVTASGTNAPESTWFYLDVKRANDGRIVQTWQRDNIPTDRYVRTYTDNQWSNWERSASYSEYSTLNQTVKGLQSTVSNNYTNLQSQISQTAGTIRSEITDKTTNLQSQITQNANSFNIRLQNATSGGGINLARNTSDIWNDSGWNDFNGASNQTKIITQVYFEGLHVGDWVTGYIEYQYQNLSGNDMHIYIQGFGNKTVWNGSQFGPSAQQLVASNDVKYGEFKFSFQLTEDMVYTWRNNYYNVQLRVDNAKGGWLQWNRIKFEKGTAATTWSPSPNDKVSKNKILAQINVAAGTTLIQNDKIYMDASSTVFSGKAFIPDAAITNISADKINTGTLDAGRINVINLNANNITTGTINGANLKINLNSGEILFQKGRIASTNGLLNIDLNFGTMSVTGWGGAGVYFQNGKMILDDGTTPNLDLDLSPKYGMISRSGDPLNNGLFGMQLESPNGVIMKTKNYNGNLFRGWVDKEFNGAFLGVSAKGDTDIISGRHTNISGGLPYGDSYPQQPTIVIGTDDGRDTNGSGKKEVVLCWLLLMSTSQTHIKLPLVQHQTCLLHRMVPLFVQHLHLNTKLISNVAIPLNTVRNF